MNEYDVCDRYFYEDGVVATFEERLDVETLAVVLLNCGRGFSNLLCGNHKCIRVFGITLLCSKEIAPVLEK